MRILSIIGSGDMAAAIGALAAEAGHTVEVMARDPAKGQALAERIGVRATTGDFGAVPLGDIVVLAVPYSAVLDVVRQYGEALGGKVLVDPTNPVALDMVSFETPSDSFGAREIAKAAPFDTIVVKAFNTHFSPVLTGWFAEHPVEVFLAGNDLHAKALVGAYILSFGLRPLDVGPLIMARTLEHVFLLSLGIMAHSLKHANFGIEVRLSAERP